MVAQALEQPHGHRRVVDEGAVTAGARQLAANDYLPLLEAEPGLVEHRRRGAARSHLEHGLDGGRLGVGADDVGLGARTAYQKNRVEEHRLAGAGLAGQYVEPGLKRHGDAVDDGEVASANLEEHLADARSAPRTPQAVSERIRR